MVVYGDLDDLLAKSADSDLVKAAAPDHDDQADHDEDDVDGPDDVVDQGDEGEDTDREAASDLEKAYQLARAEWLAREPRPDLGDLAPASGTALLVKQAVRQRWQDRNWPMTCERFLHSLLPAGSRLTVWSTHDGGVTWWTRTYVATGERIRT